LRIRLIQSGQEKIQADLGRIFIIQDLAFAVHDPDGYRQIRHQRFNPLPQQLFRLEQQTDGTEQLPIRRQHRIFRIHRRKSFHRPEQRTQHRRLPRQYLHDLRLLADVRSFHRLVFFRFHGDHDPVDINGGTIDSIGKRRAQPAQRLSGRLALQANRSQFFRRLFQRDIQPGKFGGNPFPGQAGRVVRFGGAHQ